MKIHAMIVTTLLLTAPFAESATINLQCEPGAATPSVPVATSYTLHRKQPGETTFTPFLEKDACQFDNVTVVDNGETCFHFGAKNKNGVAVRIWSTICEDPTQYPPSFPTKIGIK